MLRKIASFLINLMLSWLVLFSCGSIGENIVLIEISVIIKGYLIESPSS